MVNTTAGLLVSKGSELILYTFGNTARITGGLAIQALAIPCIRNGAILAGSAHTARHFAGPYLGVATLAAETALFYATGSNPAASAAVGVTLYYLPKGLEFFAQKAVSKTAFFALDAIGMASWYLASKGVGLAAFGIGSAYKGMLSLWQSKPASQQMAPTAIVLQRGLSKQNEELREQVISLTEVVNQMSDKIKAQVTIPTSTSRVSASATKRVRTARNVKKVQQQIDTALKGSSTTSALSRRKEKVCQQAVPQQVNITPRRSPRLRCQIKV